MFFNSSNRSRMASLVPDQPVKQSMTAEHKPNLFNIGDIVVISNEEYDTYGLQGIIRTVLENGCEIYFEELDDTLCFNVEDIDIIRKIDLRCCGKCKDDTQSEHTTQNHTEVPFKKDKIFEIVKVLLPVYTCDSKIQAVELVSAATEIVELIYSK